VRAGVRKSGHRRGGCGPSRGTQATTGHRAHSSWQQVSRSAGQPPGLAWAFGVVGLKVGGAVVGVAGLPWSSTTKADLRGPTCGPATHHATSSPQPAPATTLANRWAWRRLTRNVRNRRRPTKSCTPGLTMTPSSPPGGLSTSTQTSKRLRSSTFRQGALVALMYKVDRRHHLVRPATRIPQSVTWPRR